MYYVYQLIENGKVIYIGETMYPKQRLYDHTKRKPKAGHGKFYGLDLEIEIIECMQQRKKHGIDKLKNKRNMVLQLITKS